MIIIIITKSRLIITSPPVLQFIVKLIVGADHPLNLLMVEGYNIIKFKTQNTEFE